MHGSGRRVLLPAPGQSRSCPENYVEETNMYEHVFQFFGLRENPFHVSPDPRFFFSTKAHSTALTELTMGIDTHQGFLVLTGEAGTGKTILSQRLLTWLQARGQSSCYIFQSQLNPLELFESILHDFGVPCDSRRVSDVLSALNEWLVRRHALGDSPVVIIDEAQAISLRTLDRLRMLLNLETPGSKLLQIVLAGQPELDEKLRRPELRQLQQRVMFRCSLASLAIEETAEYIKSRLARAGLRNASVFPEESLAAVHLYAQGIPRVINLLCEHALIAAYTDNENIISPDVISRVATIFELSAYSTMASKPEELPSYGGLTPELEKPKHHSAKSAALAQFIDRATAPPPWAHEPAAALEPVPIPVTAPIVPLQTPIALAAVAGAVGSARGASPDLMASSQVSREPIFAPPPKRLEIADHSHPSGNNGSPRNGHHSGVGSRIADYGRGVRESFVRDWKQFLRSYAQTKKVSGPDSSGV